MKNRLRALIFTNFIMGIGAVGIDPKKLKKEISNRQKPEQEIHPPDPDSPEYQAYMESCRQRGLRDMESQIYAQHRYYQLHPEELYK